MEVNKEHVAAGIMLGILASLAYKHLRESETPNSPLLTQPEERVNRARAVGMTPAQLDKYDIYNDSGYFPQHRSAITEVFGSLTRPSRKDALMAWLDRTRREAENGIK